MNKKTIISILLAALVVSQFIFIVNGEQNDNPKISKDLINSMKSTDGPIPVIIILDKKTKVEKNIALKTVKENALESQKEIIDELKKVKADKIKSLWIINAVAAEVSPNDINEIAKRSDVDIIVPDYPIMMADSSSTEISSSSNVLQGQIQSIPWHISKINAPAVWANGIDGSGITVAIIDTGIDNTHPDLDDLDDNPATTDPKVIGWIDYIDGLPSPYDDHDHGTHVAGTVSGTGANGIQTGVAPQTFLLGAKIWDAQGNGITSDAIAAFGWAVTNNADVISMSGGWYAHSDIWTPVIDNTIASGVIPIIAGGNEGPSASTIRCPGDEKFATTVGATDINDVIASFSSRGPVTLYQETYIKPDVSAPGVDITSTVPGGGYGYGWSGTSMATPHVSGVAALMLQHNPALTPQQIKQTLESTSVDLGTTGKDNNYGAGRIDAYAAVFGVQQGTRVAIYQSEGTPDGTALQTLLLSNGYQADIVSPTDVENGILSQYDVFVYGHGSGENTQAFKDAVTQFKANGGGLITEWLSSAVLLSEVGPNIINPVPNWGWYQGIADYGGSVGIDTPIDILDNIHPIFQGVADPFAGMESTEYFFTAQNLDPRLTVIAEYTGHGGTWPAIAVEEGMLPDEINVLFYEGHVPSGNAPGYFSTSDVYQNLVTLLNSSGMTVSTSTAPTLTLQEISGYDVVVIAEPTVVFNQQEIDDLNQYVNNGGGLMVLGEYGTFAIQQGIYDSVNGITSNYGINFTPNIVKDELNNDGGSSNWPVIPNFDSSVAGSVVNSVVYASAPLDLTGPAYAVGWASPSAYIAGGQMNVISAIEGTQILPIVSQVQINNDPNIDNTTGDEISNIQAQDLTPKSSIAQNENVLWDLTHGVYLGYEPSQRYSTLVSLLGAKGYTVDTTSTGILNVDLNQYDVLVICVGGAWNSAYTQEEVQAISNFVQNGGGLLIMGDNPNTNNQNINPVSQQFGTTLGVGVSTLEPLDLYIDNFTQQPIFNGISMFYYRAAGEIDVVAPSEAAAWTGNLGVLSIVNDYGQGKVVITGDSNFPENSYIAIADNQLLSENIFDWLSTPNQEIGPVVMAASEYGSGRVLAIGDGNLFSNGDPDSDGTINLEEYDNELLAVNAVKWLAGDMAGITNLNHILELEWGPVAPDVGHGTIGENGTDGSLVMFFFDAWDTPDVNSDMINLWLNSINYVAGGALSIPDIWVEPMVFDVTLPENTVEDYAMAIGNDGYGTLTYNMGDVETVIVSFFEGQYEPQSQPNKVTVSNGSGISVTTTMNVPHIPQIGINAENRSAAIQIGIEYIESNLDPTFPYIDSVVALLEAQLKGYTVNQTLVQESLDTIHSSSFMFSSTPPFEAYIRGQEAGYIVPDPRIADDMAMHEYWVSNPSPGYEIYDVSKGLIGLMMVQKAGYTVEELLCQDGVLFLEANQIGGDWGSAQFNFQSLWSLLLAQQNGYTVDTGVIQAGIDNEVGSNMGALIVLVESDKLGYVVDSNVIADGEAFWIAYPESEYGVRDLVALDGETIDCPWLDENPKSGIVTAGAFNNIIVTINTAGLDPGNYSAEIMISSNDPDENPVVVPVDLTVTGGQGGNRVLFDAGHGNYYTPSYGYTLFVAALEQQGYTIDVLDSLVTPEVLAAHDVFITAAPDSGFTPAEIADIQQYIDNGGSVLLIGEWGNGWGSDYLALIAAPYGISPDGNVVYQPTNYYVNDFWPIISQVDSPIQNVASYVEYAGSSITVTPPAQAIAWSDSDAYVSSVNALTENAQTFGPVQAEPVPNMIASSLPMIAISETIGRVAYIGDSGTFSDNDASSNGIPCIDEFDNKEVALSLVNWLAGGFAPTGPTVYVDPAYQDQSPGAVFSVDINVDPQLSEVYAGQYEVHFDPVKLEALSQTQGDFLSQDGAGTMVLPNTIDNVNGIATYGEFRIGVQTGVTNSGTLATIEFHVKAQVPPGETPLDLMNVVLSDPQPQPIPDVIDIDGTVNILDVIPPVADAGADILTCENVGTAVSLDGSGSYDPDGTIVSYDWNFGDGNVGSGVNPIHTYTVPNYDGYTATLKVTDNDGATDSDTATVVIWIAGDANGDRTVNILDAAMVGLHWSETPNNPNFSPCADLNNDNVINILDAALIGIHWGETLPQN